MRREKSRAAANALAGADSDRLIAKRLDRAKSVAIVRNGGPRPKWSPIELAMLRNHPPGYVAKIIGRSVEEVQAKRQSLWRNGSK